MFGFRKSCLRVLVLGLFAVTAAGCGKKDGDKSEATVTGSVKFDGKALPGGEVRFLTEEAIAQKATGIAGQIESDGTYKIVHVPLGPVKIIVFGPTRSSDASVKTIPITIPIKYQNKDQSGLSYTVVAGTNTKDIELTSK